MPRDTEAKAWMLTLNNPVLDVLEICAIFELLDVKYIWQFEIGDNGTPHVQAFIEFSKKKRFSYVRRRMDDNGIGGCHLENCHGRVNGINYCRKEDTRTEGPFTNLSDYELDQAGQGRRRDLEKLKADIEDGKSRLNIAQTHFSAFLMYNNGITKYQQLLQRPRDFKTKVLYLEGEPGTGKSRLALNIGKLMRKPQREDGDIYYKNSGKWWDHYENDTTVIWDDFRGCDYRLSELLKLMDRYPYKVENKGGMLEFNSTLLILTSNVMFNLLYHSGNEPIKRRIDLYLHVVSYEREGVNAITLDNPDTEYFSAAEIVELLFE